MDCGLEPWSPILINPSIQRKDDLSHSHGSRSQPINEHRNAKDRRPIQRCIDHLTTRGGINGPYFIIVILPVRICDDETKNQSFLHCCHLGFVTSRQRLCSSTAIIFRRGGLASLIGTCGTSLGSWRSCCGLQAVDSRGTPDEQHKKQRLGWAWADLLEDRRPLLQRSDPMKPSPHLQTMFVIFAAKKELEAL